MSVLDTIKQRRSIREFLDRKIPPGLVDDLKEALIWAPSAGNLQARRFYFVFNKGVREQLASAALNQQFIAQSPLAIVACTDSSIKLHYGQRGEYLYTIQDVSASIMGMMLVAHDAGLGTVWIGAFDELEVSKILGLPANLKPVAIVPAGYPSSVPSAPSRVSKVSAITEITE